MMRQEMEDCARLVLEQYMTMLANELAQLARSFRGKLRSDLEALSSEARQMISCLE